MKILAAFVLALAAAAAAHARPLIIEETARVANPDPSNEVFGYDVAIDGDDAFATAWHPDYGDPEDEYDDQLTIAVWLFRRINGTWTPVRKLTEFQYYCYVCQWGIAARNGVFALDPLRIFEKINGDWVQATIDWSSGAYDGPGDSLNIDGQRVLIGNSDGTFQGTLFEKGADGLWRRTTTMYGEYRGGDDENHGRDVGLSGDRAIVMSPYTEESRGYDTPNASVFRKSNGSWQQEFVIANSEQTPLADIGEIHDDEIVIPSWGYGVDAFVFRPLNGGPDWALADQLRHPGSYMGGGGGVHITDDYLLQKSFDYDGNRSVVNVYAKDANGAYAHVATLVASDGGSLGAADISGRRVIAGCQSGICMFDLPTSFAPPAVLQDTFAGTTPTGWTLSAGSQFAITQSGASRVLRQSETASTATHTALLTASNQANESIEADVRPLSFNGSDRWVGLATRYQDAGNHYYITLRASNVIRLRKLVNGAQFTLASAALPVTLGRTYRLRLESIGKHHRVYVDGVPVLDAIDGSFASGPAGLLTYRASAEFDNVVVTPSPVVTVLQTDLNRAWDGRLWDVSGPAVWGDTWTGTETVFTQTSTAGDARAVTGVANADQQVEFKVRATAYATGGSSGDRWFGAMARYTDVANYYYVSVRSGGTISLRKLVNGAITVLASTSMPVTLNQWYTLRLEAVGTRLRAYVDGNLVLEATDSTHSSGRTGMVTWRTAAQFQLYRAVQP
jgi:hypothetical protein